MILTLLTNPGFITTKNIYRPLYTFLASAGVGSYDPTYTNPAVWPDLSMISFDAGIAFEGIFINPLNRYILSLNTDTHSSTYFFPGGLNDMTPYPLSFTNYSDVDVIFVHHVLGLQMDYWVPDPVQMNPEECKAWEGGDFDSLQLCISTPKDNQSYIIAGKNIYSEMKFDK